MSIKLEFCNVIVPIAKIRGKLGEGAFETELPDVIETNWRDEHLFREGCMNEYDLADILDEWEQRGFEPLTLVDGKKHWKDVCVVNSWHGPSYPCEWIEYDPERNIVWLKGTDPGEPVGPAE